MAMSSVSSILVLYTVRNFVWKADSTYKEYTDNKQASDRGSLIVIVGNRVFWGKVGDEVSARAVYIELSGIAGLS